MKTQGARLGIAWVCLGVALFALGCGRPARPATETVLILSGTHHVGDDYMANFSEAPAPEGLHVSAGFQVPRLPRKATLLLDVADADISGCEVWLNNKRLGELSIGREWHTDSFEIPRGLLREGQNNLLVRTRVWAETQAEDFFLRDLRLVLEN